MMIFKLLMGFVVGTVGTYMMIRGKKLQDTKMMIIGGVLLVASYWVFSWGGDDKEDAKALMNMVNPTATTQPSNQP